MKTFEVEIRYTAYANYTVEAVDMADAQKQVWAQIDANPERVHEYGEWECLDVEEVKPCKT